ncbi:unnamed protein product [Ectocarpus sp. 4 AP-2014]
MLRSALTSALSACLAVFTTLLYQQWASPSPQLQQQHVPVAMKIDREQELAGSPSTAPPSPTTVDLAQALGLGRVLLSRGEHEEAALVYRVAASAAAAIDANREQGEAQHGLGLALLATGRPEEALVACREAERLDPDLPTATSCIGAILTDAGNIAGALTALRHAAEKAERGGVTAGLWRDAEGTADTIHGRLGTALLASGEVDEAIEVLTRVELEARRAGGDPHAAYNLGVAWQTKGETEKAIVAYSRAADVAPTLAAPRVNLGAQLLRSGRLAEAEAVLLSAAERARDDPISLAATYSNLGAVLKRSGKPEEALESYSRAVQSGAGRQSLVHIAKLHHELGQSEQAREACRRAMLEEGDSLDASPLLVTGLILESLGNVGEAADHFTKVVYQDAENFEATMHLGACQQRLGQHHEALASFLAASRLQPDNPAIYESLLSTVNDAKRATGKEVDDNEHGDVGDRNPEPEGHVAAGALDEEASPELVVGQAGGAKFVGVERAGGRQEGSNDGVVAVEADLAAQSTGGLEEQASRDPQNLRAVDAGSKPHGEGSEAGFPAAATAAVQETGRVEVVGQAASSGDSRSHVPVVNVAKTVPGSGDAGASVRQDSAEMRRQSESLRDDDAVPTTTRGFFGKEVPEGPTKAAVTATPSAVIPLTLTGTGGEGDAEAKGAAVANPADETLLPHDPSTDGIIGVHPFEGICGSEDEGVAMAVDGNGLETYTQETHAQGTPASSSGTEPSAPAKAANLDSGMVEEALAARDDDNIGSTVAGSIGNQGTADDIEQGERHVLPPGTELPVPNSNGNVESTAVVGLDQAEADALATLKTKLGSSSKEGEGRERGPTVPGLEVPVVEEEEDEEEKERQANGRTVPATAAEREFASLSLNDANANGAQTPDGAVDADNEGDGPQGLVEEDGSVDGGSDSFEEGDKASRDPVADVIHPAEPYLGSANGDTVSGDGHDIATRLGTDNSLGPEDDATAPAGGSVDAVSEKSVDEEAVHAVGEKAVVRGETEEAEARRDSPEQEVVDGVGAADVTVDTQSEELDLPPTAVDTPATNDGFLSEQFTNSLGEQAKEGISEESLDGDNIEQVSSSPGEHAKGSITEGSMDGDDIVEARDPATIEVGAADDGTDEATGGNSRSSGDASGGSGDTPATEVPKGPQSDETEAGTADSADAVAEVPVGPIVVSEDDAKRARAKAKLGMAKLQQGQAKKAVSLFEKAASIDPGWWGGFYYAALAHDALGNAEAAAGALVSALSVPAPAEENEVAGLSALSSKVLAALDRGKQVPVAAVLKTAMDTSGLTFAVAPPIHDPPSQRDLGKSGNTNSVSPQGTGVGERTANMGGSAGVERANSRGTASKPGREADLASRFGRADEAAGAVPSREGRAREGLENIGRELPSSGQRGPAGGDDGARRAAGDDRTYPGTARGTGSGRPQRGEASRAPTDPLDLWNDQDLDRGEARGGGGERLKDSSGGGDRNAPSTPDVGHRRRWGQSGDGDFGDAAGGSHGAAAPSPGIGGGAGPPIMIDSKASADDILASMGLKSGAGLGSDRVTAVGGARTPEDMMAAASSGGGDGGGQLEGKKGLFRGLWNRKSKRKEG